MLRSISHPLYNLSHQEFYHTYLLHIYTCHTSHILWKNLQAYNIGDSEQWKRNAKIKTHSHLLGIVSQLNDFHAIPSQTFTTYNSSNSFSGIHLTSSKRYQQQHDIPLPKV